MTQGLAVVIRDELSRVPRVEGNLCPGRQESLDGARQPLFESGLQRHFPRRPSPGAGLDDASRLPSNDDSCSRVARTKSSRMDTPHLRQNRSVDPVTP